MQSIKNTQSGTAAVTCAAGETGAHFKAAGLCLRSAVAAEYRAAESTVIKI